MDKRLIQEETLRAIALAAVGFAVLFIVLPEWAREGVLLFAAIYALLVVAIDANVRALLPLRKGRAKRPAARRAAT
jgi:hypothetical protein